MTSIDDALQLRSHRFFADERLTAQVLNESADAERERRWLHNRLLHGYGISFGLQVVRGAGDTSVVVGRGHALDANGRDLVVDAQRELQVPPVPRGSFDLVCEWSDSTRETSTSSCGATGETLRREVPEINFVATGTQRGVVLATVTITGCKLASLVFDSRRQLVAAPVPYVDAGRYFPRPGDWKELAVSAPLVPVGLRITVDTSKAGFFGNVSYSARVMGARWKQGWEHVLCLDAFVIEARPTSFDMGLVILADAVLTTGFDPVSLTDFIKKVNISAPGIPDALGWTVAWMGVEGTQ
jgi:hypothetical protein